MEHLPDFRSDQADAPQAAAASTSFLAWPIQSSFSIWPFSLSCRSRACMLSVSRSAICQKWKTPRSLSRCSSLAEMPLIRLRSSGSPRGASMPLKTKGSASSGGVTASPMSIPAAAWARWMPSIAARAARSQ